MKTLENLLQQTSIIQKKYDDLAEYSGEHYNIFKVVNLRTDEVSHSAILTNLLDAKGKHGQKDIFLKLFIEQIKPLLEKSRYSQYINTFDTEKATAKKEIHIGGVKYETAEGGRVDIVVSSGSKNLVIENKIYAGDQDQQLLRYDNHYKDDPIIYLTLNGVEPSKTSKGGLVLGTDFICISYHTDISNWLEKCIKEMANKPIIRETLNQYLFLIKSLTNQSNNNKMSEEISNIILKNQDNFDAFKTVYNSYNQIVKTIIEEEFINPLKNLSEINNLDFKIDNNFLNGAIYSGFTISNNDLGNNNLKIRFEFQGANFKGALLGFNYLIKEKRTEYNYEKIIEKFNVVFGSAITTSDNFACYTWYKELNHMNRLNVLEKLKYENLYEFFNENIMKMLDIVKK